MWHVLVYRRFLFCYLLITPILGLSDDGKMLLEHLNFVLNVRPNVSVTTGDAIACGLACIRRSFCFSFNFAVYSRNDNCKLLLEDKYTYSDRFEPSPLYHHYSIMVSLIMLILRITLYQMHFK